MVVCGLCLFLKCDQFEMKMLPFPFQRRGSQVVFHGGTLKNIVH